MTIQNRISKMSPAELRATVSAVADYLSLAEIVDALGQHELDAAMGLRLHWGDDNPVAAKKQQGADVLVQAHDRLV